MSAAKQLRKAKAKLERAIHTLEEAALALVRERCLELSRRFPTRLVSYETGNGARSISVARRRRAKVAEYDMKDYFDLKWCWPSYVAGTPLLDELDALEDETRQPWLATDCLYFLGGKEQDQ
jgi:hypothetical protein